jgi:hypothetical protein
MQVNGLVLFTKAQGGIAFSEMTDRAILGLVTGRCLVLLQLVSPRHRYTTAARIVFERKRTNAWQWQGDASPCGGG